MTAEPLSRHLDMFPDAMVVVGIDGVVRQANDLACRLARRPVDALVGVGVRDVLRLEDPGGGQWWDCGALMDADPALLPRIAEQRLVLHREDAEPAQVTVTGRRLPGPDGRTESVCVGLRRGDRQLQQERRRSDLISTASHELRAPLTSVRGFTKTLLARWDRFDDATRRQMLATIDEDADRVTRLLTGMLDVSRIDTGRLPLRRRIVSPAALVERLARRFALEHTDRRVEIDVATDLPDVMLDADRIEQVLTNLLQNALKHGEGTIRIGVGLTDGAVRCEVTDDGGAIPAAELNRLFVKYYRIHDTRATGLGLGLYISRGIVVAHGGDMWATSSHDDGTRFVFTLPLAPPELA